MVSAIISKTIAKNRTYIPLTPVGLSHWWGLLDVIKFLISDAPSHLTICFTPGLDLFVHGQNEKAFIFRFFVQG